MNMPGFIHYRIRSKISLPLVQWNSRLLRQLYRVYTSGYGTVRYGMVRFGTVPIFETVYTRSKDG